MVGWLRLIFSGRRPRPTSPIGDAVEVEASDNDARRRLVLDAAKHIKAALIDLANVGIKLSPIAKADLNATAEKIAADWEGFFSSKEPTSGDWVLLALLAEPGTFENAIRFDDHCYDGDQLGDYSCMIREMVALAGDEWRIDRVDVENARHPGAAVPDWRQPVRVMIKAEPEVAPFELMHAKDFDWSVVFRLNERLPKSAVGRFAIFWDGQATIVFLTPENVGQLNSLCGYEFAYEEDPRDQYASSQSTGLVGVQQPNNAARHSRWRAIEWLTIGVIIVASAVVGDHLYGKDFGEWLILPLLFAYGSIRLLLTRRRAQHGEPGQSP